KTTSMRSVGLPMQKTPSLKGTPTSVAPWTSRLGWFARAWLIEKTRSSFATEVVPLAVRIAPKPSELLQPSPAPRVDSFEQGQATAPEPTSAVPSPKQNAVPTG